MSGCTWHLLAKMEKVQKNANRRRLRKVQGDRTRRESLVVDYVQNKYGGIYDEASQFYDKLRELYPYKKDLKRQPNIKYGETTREGI